MHVALISHTPDPEGVIAAAARISVSNVSALDLKEKQTRERVEALLKYLLSAGHLSPFEHASFSFHTRIARSGNLADFIREAS